MCSAGRRWGRRQRALLWAVLLAAWEAAWGQLRYSVPEEMPKGSFVGDVAKDLGLQLPELSDHGFRLIERGRMQYFALHGKTGRLVTAERIDREQLCERVQQCVLRCELIVEGEMKFYEIEVEITDINDNEPRFREAEIELKMSETTAPGSRFPLAEAHDTDFGQNSLQSYELSGDEHFSLAVQAGPGGDQRPELVASAGKKQLKYFTVNEENGNLYVNERLDREEMCGESATCSVSFEVLVHNPLNIFRVEVSIEDVNDNSPVFSNAALELDIGEWTPPGARFPLEMAQDADVGKNSLLIYRLTSTPSFSLVVKESPDGSNQPELVLESALDREEQSFFELVLTAMDGGDPVRSGTIKIRVNVTDANDNPPVFGQDQYRARLREDAAPGSRVLNISASDADTGNNARITYSFGKMSAKVLQKFMMDAESGIITLKEALDFEDMRGYTLLVEARDGGGLVAQCKVVVEVLDVNDNAPEITILTLSSPVSEDAPAGTVVALLNVNDPDSGENGQVSCELSGEAPLSIVASPGGSYKVELCEMEPDEPFL
ncbi:hypothetical protein TURU_062655 [Turdus rufiventris]|nr:hypothetical protein TURU_062655 [Turdus rufiventris]